MMINGALTIGTMDGANIEMYDAVGAENIFIFGMKEQEVYQLKQNGYNPQEYYFKNERLKRAVDFTSRICRTIFCAYCPVSVDGVWRSA